MRGEGRWSRSPATGEQRPASADAFPYGASALRFLTHGFRKSSARISDEEGTDFGTLAAAATPKTAMIWDSVRRCLRRVCRRDGVADHVGMALPGGPLGIRPRVRPRNRPASILWCR